MSRRLGVRAALVAGQILKGDVSVAAGRVSEVGLPLGDAAKGIAVPGFADIQVNGFGGVTFLDATAGEMASAAAALGRHGVVLAAPTFYSATLEQYTASLRELAELLGESPRCGLLGAHLEGPFLSSSFNGAHDPETFVEPDGGLFRVLCEAGPVAVITVAPELPGAMELIASATQGGLLVAIGHTDADLRQCRAAARAGARVLTHCWNAHRRFSARDPGPAGWALTDQGAIIGLIADGIHVAPEVLAVTFEAAGGRVALTTDAIAAAGTDASGWTQSAGIVARPSSSAPPAVQIEGGAARLADGTLAGSLATPSGMLRVLLASGVSFAAAIGALHRPQSVALGLEPWDLRPGDPAHIAVVDDDHEVLVALRGGMWLGD